MAARARLWVVLLAVAAAGIPMGLRHDRRPGPGRWFLPGMGDVIPPRILDRIHGSLLDLGASRVHANASRVLAGDKNCKGKFNNCQTCVFLLARMKRGVNTVLPAICAEVGEKFPLCYGSCHEALSAVHVNGGHVHKWIASGCYKYESYGEREVVTPCPSHVICSALVDITKEPFCDVLPYDDPFK